MPAKGDHYLNYDIHGRGVESLGHGFAELPMPDYRRATALQIVREVLKANGAVDLRWYKTPSTKELACYWDDEPHNSLWITANEVHIPSDPSWVSRPDRSPTWQKQEGDYVGWLLPGAEAGSGGGKVTTEMARVLCPVTFLQIPAGSICPECETTH